jgi:predicted N-formylglutamate amidohydrolase
MSEAVKSIVGHSNSDLLLVVDHASNAVPEGIDLGIPGYLLDDHIAIDVGAAPLARRLAAALDCDAILATVSRLVIDLHRETDHPLLIPPASDGHRIPGNEGLDDGARASRIERYWRPYHSAIAKRIAARRPALIAAVHSFTPALATAGVPRPWPVGILYNQDDRAARIAIDLLRARGFETGDNEPYSGKLLNATMNVHAEAHGIPYVAIEVRNDGIRDDEGVERWTKILAPVLTEVRNRLA